MVGVVFLPWTASVRSQALSCANKMEDGAEKVRGRALSAADYARAHAEIAQVALPDKDPVTGDAGPLLEHWRG